jgi:putative ABC transport system permease protein
LRALVAALAISAAALSAVGAFTERVEKALATSANELLAADLVVRSRRVFDNGWDQEAATRGLASARTTAFPSVAFHGDESLLVQVKAVSEGYPLRGKLTLSEQPFGPARNADSAPPAGTVWVDPGVVNQLQVPVGESLELGELKLIVDAVIVLEPDRANGLFNIAPRVMMNASDLAASGLIGEGSRVRHQFLIAGDEEPMADFRSWLESRLQPGQYFQSLKDSQQQVASALDRSQRFLSLAALTAVILAGVAVVISVRQFVSRHLDTVAILRCLGAPQRPVLTAFALQLLWLALPALVVGVALGYGAQSLLVWGMGDLIPESLPLPGLVPGALAMLTGLLALFGYGFPPMLALRQVPPVRVLNRQLGQPRPSHLLSYLAPVGFSIGLIFWQARDVTLGVAMTGGIAATIALLTGAAWILVRMLRQLSKGRGLSWRFGLANVAKRGSGSLLQIAGLGLGLMVIFLLGVIQADLMKGWRESLPENAPNYFLINIQPEQVESTRQYISEAGIKSQGLFPMATARLLEINGEVPDPEDFADPRAENRIKGNVRLSWSEELPKANRVIKGEWWSTDQQAHQVSLARSWADELELEIGDTLTFDVGSERVTAEITSIREVDWDSFEVNFFILLTPAAIDEVPHSFISSLYVEPTKGDQVSNLVRLHSNISVINVGAVLQRVRTIIDRVSLTVQSVFGFTLLAGVTVLVAALQAGLVARIYEGAVLRTLGGSRKQLRRAVLSEFAMLGGVAGLLAAVAAIAVGWILADQVFKMPYQPSLWLPPAGLALGAIGIALTGLIGSRPVLSTPPVAILRKA